jgi:hypothetical protein
MWENPEWITGVLTDKKADIPNHLRPIITDWNRNYVQDSFIIMSHQPKYSIFMGTKEPNKAYGVHGISDSIEDTCTIPTPYVANTVLLPFNNRIIFGSILFPHNKTFNQNEIALINTAYKKAVDDFGIIEVLNTK